MWALASHYHWSPEVIRNLDLDDMFNWLEGIIWFNSKNK